MPKGNNSRLLPLAFLVILFFLLIGCSDRRELDDLAIVIAVAFDLDQETGEHAITYQSIIPTQLKSGVGSGSSAQQSGTESAYHLDTDKGNTWVEPTTCNPTHNSRTLFFPYNQANILGQELAKQGVYSFVEHTLRLVESRPNRLVLVAENKASDILQAKVGLEPALGLDRMIKLSADFSDYPAVTMLEFAGRMMSKTSAPFLPIIGVMEETDAQGKKSKQVAIKGTAVFKFDKMVGELNKKESRGLLWVIGRIKHGAEVVDAPDGSGKATLLIRQARSKLKPEMIDGKITMVIEIEAEADLAEYKGFKDQDPSLIHQFEASQNTTIKNEVMTAVNKSRSLNADIFGFGEAVHRKYKREWPAMESHWDKIYPNLEVVVKVKTQLKNVQGISKPVIKQ